MVTAAHPADPSIWEVVLSYWWLLLIFGGTVFGWITEALNIGVSALRKRVQARRRHQLRLKRLELQIARTKAANVAELPAAPKPGPCVHRDVKPVVSPFPEEKVVAWLCRSCDKQLPANWAVREEDL